MGKESCNVGCARRQLFMIDCTSSAKHAHTLLFRKQCTLDFTHIRITTLCMKTGAPHNIPEGWSAIDACMNVPVEIKGITLRCIGARSTFINGSLHICGYWMVDWGQPDCRPWYRKYHDRGGRDWWPLCHSTPLVWNLIYNVHEPYPLPGTSGK
jgi:hypothetical protein